MKQDNYNVIGVMSGTSLDGVDLAQIQLTLHNNKWTFKIIESETVRYEQNWINYLKLAVDYPETELVHSFVRLDR
jgi:anhydro-N-acetylmuramic acid kinase